MPATWRHASTPAERSIETPMAFSDSGANSMLTNRKAIAMVALCFFATFCITALINHPTRLLLLTPCKQRRLAAVHFFLSTLEPPVSPVHGVRDQSTLKVARKFFQIVKTCNFIRATHL